MIRSDYFLLCLFILLASGGFISAQHSIVDMNNYGAQKAYHSRNTADYSVWDYVEHDCQYADYEWLFPLGNIPRKSQANFLSLAEGRVSISCLNFRSYEKPFFFPGNMKQDELGDFMCLTGIKPDDIASYQKDCDYFGEFIQFYYFLRNHAGKRHRALSGNFQYALIDNKRTLQELHEGSEDLGDLGLILNISGGHVLGNSIYLENGLHASFDYRNLVMDNIKRLKAAKPIYENTKEYLEYPVFYITLASFFDNGICGTFLPPVEKRFGLAGLTGKRKSDEMGFTPLGRAVVNELLNKERGRRVLIDISGMNLQSRKDFYQLLDEINAREEHTIPILASHSGISNLSWHSKEYLQRDDKKNKDSYLNNWSANLAREDLKAIYQSGGLISITLDGTYLMGQKAEKELNQAVAGSAQHRKAFLRSLLANIFTVVKVLDQPGAWDHIAIGTNFDNLVPTVPGYRSAKDLPRLREDLMRWLETPEDLFDLFTASEVERLMYGISPQDLANKVFEQNAFQFLSDHLPDEQLATRINVFGN